MTGLTHTTHGSRRVARVSLTLATLLVALATLSPSHAVERPLEYRDSFETVGPLPSDPSDPYEVKRGSWEVVNLPDVLTTTNPRRVLRQNSLDGTPSEPMMFIRDASFQNLTVEVTAALIDNVQASSLGIVFRAPILEDQTADPSNLYLFNAVNSGYVPGFQGKAFTLHKRIGNGYYLLDSKIASTYVDLTRPHRYKVQMYDGHIRAFVDGRLVIEHTDKPSPDVPTTADPFPGLPFHSGSVGLRTSKARAWFDDLVVVADDAYEGRAAAAESTASYPYPGQNGGLEYTATNEFERLGLNAADTGSVYATQPFDKAVVRPHEDGALEAGSSLRTFSKDGSTVSTARVGRLKATFADPLGRASVSIDAAKIESIATASCDATSSRVDLASTTITITVAGSNGAPDTTIGPFPIESSYGPNTILFQQPGVFQVIAHRQVVASKPRWIQASALSIVFPVGDLILEQVNVGGDRVLPQQNLGKSPGLVIDLGLAVAGRTCTQRPEGNG